MKLLHVAAFAVVLSLASVPVVSAQEPEQDKEKAKQQDQEKKKQPSEKEKSKSDEKAKADTRSEKDKAKPETDRRDQAQRQDDRTRQDDRARQDDRSATHEQQSGRSDADRGRGHRIPDERFRASFGTEHHFHVGHHDNRRFEYSGYWFEYVDAWPADWSDDDDVYIALIGDDYYLLDARHPEVRLRLILVD
jgi:hypothetical protein